MRAIVTGGAGFIGSHVTDALIAAGHEVVVIDDMSRGQRENVHAKAELAQVSITSPEVEQVIAEFRPDAVFHHAAQMDVRKSVADPVFDSIVNVSGTVRVAAAAARAGCQLFSMASTGGAIYGEQERFPADETHVTKAESPYGVSKLCGEIYLGYFQRTFGMRCVALRYATVYGPRQDPHGEAGVVAIFAQKMLRNEVPTIFGDGEQTRDYVFVGDVVAANMTVLANTQARGSYNIGTGIETNVNTLAKHIAKSAHYSGNIDHAAGKPGEQRRSVLDCNRARSELGWTPKVALADGLETTVKWFARS
jgi:UDP-glucose 4-epimerase